MLKIHFTESFKPRRKNYNVDNIFVKEPQTLEEADVEDRLPNAATVLNLHKDVSAFERRKSFEQSLTSQQKRKNQTILYQITNIPPEKK